MTHDPNRPTGSVPPERDRTVGGATPPPEHRGPNRNDGGNSAMALIVGALAVALIIGAFFWFAGDTQDTATLDDPAVVEEDMGAEEETLGTDEEALGTDEEVIEQDTDVTVVEPTEEEAVIDETQELGAEDEEVIGETQEPGTEETEVIDETQQ